MNNMNKDYNFRLSDFKEAMRDSSLIPLIKMILNKEIRLSYSQGCVLNEIAKTNTYSFCKYRNVGASTILIYYAIACILFSEKPIKICFLTPNSIVPYVKEQFTHILNNIRTNHPYLFETALISKRVPSFDVELTFNGSELKIDGIKNFLGRRGDSLYDCIIVDEENKEAFFEEPFFSKLKADGKFIECRTIDKNFKNIFNDFIMKK